MTSPPQPESKFRSSAAELKSERTWVQWAIGQLQAEATRTADTHIEKLVHPRIPSGVDVGGF